MNPAQYRAMEIRHKNDLMHHGIDGQKWGVKHGPPYPLDDSKSTGSRLKTKKKKKLSTDHEKAIKKGALIGAVVGGPVGAIIGGTIASRKHSKKATKQKSKNKQESSPAPKAKETYNESISKNRENSLRKEVKEYLENRAGPWNDGSEIKFLSERVLTYEDGSKSVESMFSNDKAWITIEKNYDANGKMTSRYVGLDD